jgi:hypothetical protein
MITTIAFIAYPVSHRNGLPPIHRTVSIIPPPPDDCRGGGLPMRV